MAGRTEQHPFPWLGAAAGSLLVVLGGSLLLRLPPPPDPAGVQRAQAKLIPMRLAGGGTERQAQAVREELLLRDPAPLFLPTPLTSGQAQPPPGVRREPGAAFGRFDPKLNFRDNDPDLTFPAPVEVPVAPLAAVEALSPGPALTELSRREVSLPPLTERLGHLEVSDARTGQIVINEDLVGAGGGAPPALQQELWAPIEVIVAISAGGMVGRPAIVSGSGSEAIDAWALELLTGTARLAPRLRPGIYHLLLGP